MICSPAYIQTNKFYYSTSGHNFNKILAIGNLITSANIIISFEQINIYLPYIKLFCANIKFHIASFIELIFIWTQSTPIIWQIPAREFKKILILLFPLIKNNIFFFQQAIIKTKQRIRYHFLNQSSFGCKVIYLIFGRVGGG